jgi:hypothetical protein
MLLILFASFPLVLYSLLFPPLPFSSPYLACGELKQELSLSLWFGKQQHKDHFGLASDSINIIWVWVIGRFMEPWPWYGLEPSKVEVRGLGFSVSHICKGNLHSMMIQSYHWGGLGGRGDKMTIFTQLNYNNIT